MAGGGESFMDSLKNMQANKGTTSIWDTNNQGNRAVNPWYTGGTVYNPGSNPMANMPHDAAPQAPPTAQAQAPWMSQLGGMGQQMMNRSAPPPMHPMAHNMPGPGPGLMQMPQPLTPTQVNQALINHTGLLGRGGLG